jgi:nitrile hydratase accessory protein
MKPSLEALQREVPGLPRDAGEPIFKAPWEAQAFAMAVALHERGAFTWPEWAATLAQVLAEVRTRGEADDGSEYYRHWMSALERIATGKGLVDAQLLRRRRDEWDHAARHTPHGQPIELRR